MTPQTVEATDGNSWHLVKGTVTITLGITLDQKVYYAPDLSGSILASHLLSKIFEVVMTWTVRAWKCSVMFKKHLEPWKTLFKKLNVKKISISSETKNVLGKVFLATSRTWPRNRDTGKELLETFLRKDTRLYQNFSKKCLFSQVFYKKISLCTVRSRKDDQNSDQRTQKSFLFIHGNALRSVRANYGESEKEPIRFACPRYHALIFRCLWSAHESSR